MSEDFSTVEPGAVVPVLDGVWLRRERERIAIGRRQVAVRLGLPESRVIRVELNKLPVPAEWLPALAGLGFPVPAEVLPAHTTGETIRSTHGPAPVDDLPSVEPAPAAAEPDSPAIASPAATASSLDATTDASPTLPAPAAAPEAAPETIATLPETATSPSAPIAEPDPLPIAAPVMVEATAAIEPPTAPHAEPPAAPSPAPSDASPIYTGHWLRRERKKRGMMPIAIAPALHVTAAELAIAEAQDSPLPLHWLPSLRRLGLPVSEAAAALAPQSTPSPQVAPPPAAKPPAKAQRTASTAAKADSKPERKPPTGAWLRQQRLQRNLMQRELSARLKTNPSELCRYEMKDRPLRPEWLPILRELGFPLPTAPNDRSPQKRAAAVAESVKPSAKSTTQETAHTAIDGRWLKRERTRLGLSVHAVRLRLHVSAKTYARFEASRGLVPRFWWPGLRQIGMRLPATPPAQPEQPTPNSGPWNGAWLARERRRLRLTQYEVCRVLQANPRMIHRIERDAAELPKAWLAKLPSLGIAVDAAAAAQRSAAGKTSRSSKTVPNTPPTSGQKPAIPASTAACETVTSAPAATAASQGADLVALIVNFRLTLGQHTKQPPFEILNRILSDLREAGADQALTHEDVERAARGLIRKR